MRTIYLIFLLSFIVFGLADYSYSSSERMDFDYNQNTYNSRPGSSKMKAVGTRSCKCVNFCQGTCMEVVCCQRYKAECNKYPNKYPTLSKPKN